MEVTLKLTVEELVVLTEMVELIEAKCGVLPHVGSIYVKATDAIGNLTTFLTYDQPGTTVADYCTEDDEVEARR